MGWLDGVRVVDLSRLLPGPWCTWLLRGMGAEVVKVEDPRGGDWLRHVPPHRADGVGAWFAAINAGKRSVALDLRTEAGREALLALLADADVLVEGFRPGVLERMGLAPDALARRFPRLVVARLSGYGQEGPWRDRPGHDLDYEAISGLLSLGPRHDGLPDPPPVPVADLAGGMLAALQVVAALLARERTGRGAVIDVSLAEAALSLVAPVLAAAAATGRPPEPGGDALTGGVHLYGLYRCADGGALALAALEPRFQAALAEALGELPATREALAARLAERPRDEWAERLAPACAAPVLDVLEAAEHPVHRARGSVVGEGSDARVRAPFPGADAPLDVPGLGEHTADELRRAGVDPAPHLAALDEEA